MSSGHGKPTAADRWTYAFYGAGALSALVGQVWAAASHVPFPPTVPIWARWVIVTPAVAVIEIGGVAMTARADLRRRLGENAYGYRVLSAAVACFAVAFNWIGHDPGSWLAFWFAGFSSMAYVVWLFHSGDRRRDALRGADKLAQVAPAYGIWQWMREPQLTRRARSLAVEFGYGPHKSLREARRQVRDEARRAALAKHVETRIRARHKDAVRAEIAATTYDMDALAAAIESRADYPGWAAVIGADLAPEPGPVPPHSELVVARRPSTAAADGGRAVDGDVEVTADPPRHDGVEPDEVSARAADEAEQTPDDKAEPDGDNKAEPDGDDKAEPDGDGEQESPTDTAAAVAYWHDKDPTMHPVDIAARIGKSERTVRRYWPPVRDRRAVPAEETNGAPVSHLTQTHG
jgi:hypothetical protein